MELLKNTVIISGIYSIIGGFPLAMPVLYKQYYAILNVLNTALSLGGDPIVAPADGSSMLLVNTAGLLMLSMGFLLLYGARDLKVRSGIPVIIATTRILFSLLVVYYTIAGNISRIWIVDAVIDTTLSIMMLVLVRRCSIASNPAQSSK